MAITKNPLIRYKILDKCFRNPYKKYYFETLLETVNEILYEITGDEVGIKTRQLRDDIAFMRSSEGWSIELENLTDGKKKVYRYEDINFSINNAPLNHIEMDQFQSAIQVLSQFEGMPQFDGIQAIIAKLKTDLKISTDEKPFIGTNYYRLKQVDKDGKITYSIVKQITISKINDLSIQYIYPNPATNFLNIAIGSFKNQSVSITIINALGVQKINIIKDITKGNQVITLPISRLINGAYSILLNGKSAVTFIKK